MRQLPAKCKLTAAPEAVSPALLPGLNPEHRMLLAKRVAPTAVPRGPFRV
jgi:hypothetical protein